mgnify:CR=1 FL=1
MTPWIRTMPTVAADAAEAVLATRPAAVHPIDDGYILEFPVGDARLEVVARASDEGPWRAGPLSLTVRRPTEAVLREPMVRRWLADWSERFSSEGASADGQRLHDALQAVRMFADQDDGMLRRLEQTWFGQVGMLRLGFLCNQDCWFCPQSRGWMDPPRALVETWLAELADAGVDMVTLTGGEPSAYPWFCETLAEARRLGLATLVQTNAIRFAHERFVRRARQAGLDLAFVSFHSHEAEVSDRLTRSPGTWRKTVAGIHGLLDAGVGVALNACITKDNVAGLPGWADFVVRSFVDGHPDNPIQAVDLSRPGQYFARHLLVDSLVPIDEVRGPLVEATGRLVEAGVVVNATGACGFVPCVFHEAPELVPWRPRERLDDNDMSNRRFVDEVCDGCAARGHCPGLRHEVAQTFGARGLRPFERIGEAREEALDPRELVARSRRRNG